MKKSIRLISALVLAAAAINIPSANAAIPTVQTETRAKKDQTKKK